MNAPIPNPSKLDTMVSRAMEDLSAAYAGVLISVGHKLGLYKAMADAGPLSTTELAQRTGCAERYIREWLNAQAAGGYVDYHSISNTYELTPEQALVLADVDSPVFIPPAWEVPAAMWFDEEKIRNAFRSGAGIPWSERSSRLHCGVAAFYRNGYRSHLVSQWLPALEGMTTQLEQGINVADVGCGHGHSTVLMAQAFPHSRFYGFDIHAASVEAASQHAQEGGVQRRVAFDTAAATEYPDLQYGLICFFDCLHDLGDPIAAARHAAKVLAPGGTVMLIEPFAHDRTEANFSTVGRMYYTGSTMICCAHAISEGGKLVLGAQAGEARLADVFRKAGFTHFRKAAETPFNIVFEARR